MICIYRTELQEPWEEARLAPLLSRARRAELDALCAERRQEAIAGELLLQYALREQGVGTPCEWTRTEEGGILLTKCTLRVSVAHSCGAVAVAVSDGAVGLDLERVRPIGSKERLSHPDERQAVLREGDEGFLLRWVAKESVLKQCGTGFAERPDRILAEKRGERDGRLLFCVNGQQTEVWIEDGLAIGVSAAEGQACQDVCIVAQNVLYYCQPKE